MLNRNDFSTLFFADISVFMCIKMKEFVEANGGEESFHAALEQSGMTEKDIETEIVNYLKIVKLLRIRS